MGRCYRESDSAYPRYGGRNIRVAKAWIQDINNFRQWLASYLIQNNIEVMDFVTNSINYQLDRIDNAGHYTPENCRLLSRQHNTRNRAVAVNRTYASAEGDIIDGVTGEII